MTDILERLLGEVPHRVIESHWTVDFDALDTERKDAADEIKRLREILRYIWSHGDENGKVPYSWGQEYAERFIKLAKQEWEKKDV